MAKDNRPLGIRCNNPLNIRYNKKNHWKGETDPSNGFCTFSDMIYGCRAALVLLVHYYNRKHDTIRKIIRRWAPPSENDTKSYIRTVSALIAARYYHRTDDDFVYSLSRKRIADMHEIVAIASAMVTVECGPQYFDMCFQKFFDAENRFHYTPLNV